MLPKATELAARLANGPTYAVRWTKMAANQVLRERINNVLMLSGALEGLSAATNDHQEAVRAFRERRSSKFTGT